MRHPRLLARAVNTPLLITPKKLDEIVAVLMAAESPDYSFDFELPDDPEDLAEDHGAVALVRVEGTLVNRAHGLNALSGLCSYESIHAALDEVEQDEEIGSVVFLFDSPGGEVSGAFDLADRIASFPKPTKAIAADMACSAAYLLACSCDELHATQTADLGSIGVIMRHLDMSRADEKDGLRYTAIYSGARKNDGDPHAPLSEEALARFQADVDSLARLFAEKVAARRPLNVEQVLAFQAGTFIGTAAVEAGLADSITTPAALLSGKGQPDDVTEGGPMKDVRKKAAEQTPEPTATIEDTLAVVS